MINVKKGIRKNQRHIRWNWENSPDNLNHVRYHFIVVDYDSTSRENEINALLWPIIKFSAVIPIRKKSVGKVKNSDLKYLFESYDTEIRAEPAIINEWYNQLNIPIIQDKRVREKKRGSLDDWVAKYYWK